MIQAARALAALAIVLHHALYEAVSLGGDGARWAEAIQDAMPWEAGVDIFFVISGFVMAHAAGPLFGRGFDGARRFLAHRIARIVPLYWAVTALYIVGSLAGPGPARRTIGGIGTILASFLFFPVARPGGPVMPVFGIGWTLNNEMFFYLLFAAVLWMQRTRGLLCLTLALGGLVVRGWVVGLPGVAMAFWGSPIALEFLFGVWLYKAPRAPGGLVLGLMAVLGFWADVSTFGVTRPLAWGLPALLLVAAAAGARDDEHAIWRTVAMRLGDASYAIYLVHPFVMRALGLVWRTFGAAGPVSAFLFVGAVMTLSCVAATLVYRFGERPATRALRRWLEPRS